MNTYIEKIPGVIKYITIIDREVLYYLLLKMF